MKKTLTSLAVASALTFGASVQAAPIFNYTQYADIDGEAGHSALVKTEDGVTVTATAFETGNEQNSYYAYLDGSSYGEPGGLGVCKTLGVVAGVADQCTPSNDDNVQFGETLRLSFENAVSINGISFLNGEHVAKFRSWTTDTNPDSYVDTQVKITVDGSTTHIVDLAAYVDFNDLGIDLSGSVFDFSVAYNYDYLAYAPANQFYISGVSVPAPAPLALLALGLMGFAAASRKKA